MESHWQSFAFDTSGKGITKMGPCQHSRLEGRDVLERGADRNWIKKSFHIIKRILTRADSGRRSNRS